MGKKILTGHVGLVIIFLVLFSSTAISQDAEGVAKVLEASGEGRMLIVFAIATIGINYWFFRNLDKSNTEALTVIRASQAEAIANSNQMVDRYEKICDELRSEQALKIDEITNYWRQRHQESSNAAGRMRDELERCHTRTEKLQNSLLKTRQEILRLQGVRTVSNTKEVEMKRIIRRLLADLNAYDYPHMEIYKDYLE